MTSEVTPLAHYYDVDEPKHRGEFLHIRKEIMGKFGAPKLLSYSSLVLSYVTRKGLGFGHILSRRIAISSY